MITNPEIYRYAVGKHLENDHEISWQEVKPIETLLNRHSSRLAESFSMGETHNEVGRIHQALKSTDNSPPPAYVMFKDHKATVEGEPCPSTRQVCGAKEGPQARLSHLLSLILTPVADKLSDEVGTECSNTEEMVRGLQDTNTKIEGMYSRRMEDPGQNLKQIVVVSQDVKALYPSLDWDEVIKIIGEILLETKIDFKDVDFRRLSKYLAVHLSQEEINEDNLKSVIPKKVKPTRVGIAFLDKDLDSNGEDKWSWVGKRKEPSSIQKKKMVAKTLQIAVRTVLSNHIYQVDGNVFKQQKGGPIGLEITGVLARIVMLWWDRELLKKMKQLKVEVLMYLRYVDDGNIAAEAVEPGLLMEKSPSLKKQCKKMKMFQLTKEQHSS